MVTLRKWYYLNGRRVKLIKISFIKFKNGNKLTEFTLRNKRGKEFKIQEIGELKETLESKGK